MINQLRKTGKCQLHGQHVPQSLTQVFHHIIPREWQYAWWPGKYDDVWAPTSKIWAPDSIICCPTGHANIHHHIGRISDKLSIVRLALGGIPNEQGLKLIDTYRAKGNNQNEIRVAKQAFINWYHSGGSWEYVS